MNKPGFLIIECLIVLIIIGFILPLILTLFMTLFNTIYKLENKLFQLSEQVFIETLMRHDMQQSQSIDISSNRLLLNSDPVPILYSIVNNRVSRQPLTQRRRYISTYTDYLRLEKGPFDHCADLKQNTKTLRICQHASE